MNSKLSNPLTEETARQLIVLLEEQRRDLGKTPTREVYDNHGLMELLGIGAIMKRAENAEKERDRLLLTVYSQRKQLREQDCQLHPERYRLSSGATLDGYKFIGNYGMISGMMIWTKVGDIEHRATSHNLSPTNLRAFQAEELTLEELVNTVFPPEEQVNDKQMRLLAATLDFLSGGPATPHVGTGSGNSTSNLRWDGKDTNDRPRLKRK